MRSGPTGLRAVLKRLIVNFDGFSADVIVGVSNFVVARDIQASLIAPQRFRRVWNGIEPPSAPDETRGVRSILGIPADIPVIGCACRATREKGVDVLFRAFARMAPAGETDAHLVYIGDGPLFSELNALRESLPCSDRIHMLGYRAGAADLLADVTVCVVPSVWQEAFGLSVVEMMARQRPVIATRVGGIPEIIEDGSSGVLVDSGDADELAGALSSVCASPALQISLGRAARERASAFFSSEQQLAAMIATFQDVLAH
jgi:glycosyltransferase involved in cell wall biosynthesis